MIVPEMQQFLTILKPTRVEMLTEGPTAFEEKVVSAHFDYLEAKLKEGIVIMAGRTLTEDQNTFGIVFFRALDLQSALELTNHDPVIIQGVMRAEVLPFRISLPENQRLGNQ